MTRTGCSRLKGAARSRICSTCSRASRSVISPAVDIYNTVSLTYALPVGGEDLHAIEGDLRLKVTDGGDAFLPLGEEADDPTLPGELAYIDDAGAVCRCWNWRDGVRTALSDDSADAFLAIECGARRMGIARPPSIAWPSCSSAI
ncbi:MAG: B3/4 domain-containing protein [Collinsella sp.]